MSNPAYPGRLKIGQTSKDPEERRRDLGSTGVLEDFILEYRALSEDYESLEREIHRDLDDVRVRADREFFTISAPEAINKIREIAGDRIESDKVFYVSPEELKIIEEAKRKDVELPDIGGYNSVDIIEVSVKVGDSINENDSIITLETDKATMEIPTLFSGKVVSLAVKVGDKISTGDLILTLNTDFINEEDKKRREAEVEEILKGGKITILKAQEEIRRKEEEKKERMAILAIEREKELKKNAYRRFFRNLFKILLKSVPIIILLIVAYLFI